MGPMSAPTDERWPSAATLLGDAPAADRRNVGLLGVSTFTTSVTPRSSASTPAAVRQALERYSTWSYSDHVDLAERVRLVDYGDVADPDGDGGYERVARALSAFDPNLDLAFVLGGDNAATWHALRAIAGDDLANWGLVTLDAHLDMRDGASNGSPVRQLIEAGLDGHHIVQVGLADFSNSPYYARQARAAGVTSIARDQLRTHTVEEIVGRALVVAGARGRPVYVDIDMDAADRSVAPACPAAAPGGLSADEIRRFVRCIAGHHNVHAIDITEIDVARDDEDQRTVRLAALLVLEALAGVQRRTT